MTHKLKFNFYFLIAFYLSRVSVCLQSINQSYFFLSNEFYPSVRQCKVQNCLPKKVTSALEGEITLGITDF
jgi:hypothetical protein